MAKKTPKPRQTAKHPATGEKDLTPELSAEQVGKKDTLLSSADIEELTTRLDFTHEELAQIRFVAAGQRLEQGAVYLDLRNFPAKPITATAETTATERNLYVAKASTPHEYWNRLVRAISGSAASRQSADGDIPEETVDKTLADSFPTSDPPAWTTGREPVDPNVPQAPREKRADPDKQ